MNAETKPIAEITSDLIAQLAPSTRVLPPSTGELNLAVWAAWLKLTLPPNDTSLDDLVRGCAAFALAVKEGGQPRWVTILGKTGVGKTHCAKRLWKALHGRFNWDRMEYLAQIVYWPAFVADLRGGGAYEREREMGRWPILCLDDIGAERDTTGFAAEHLNTLLGCRVDRWTIITSNLSLEQVGAIDPRISDRMIREPNIFIEVDTKSYAMR